MFQHGLAWHQKMPKKSAFQQSERWYELHNQVFENSKFLGDFAIVFRFILFTLFDITLSHRRLGRNWNKNPLEINVSLYKKRMSHYYKKKKHKKIKAFRLIGAC